MIHQSGAKIDALDKIIRAAAFGPIDRGVEVSDRRAHDDTQNYLGRANRRSQPSKPGTIERHFQVLYWRRLKAM